MNKENLKIKNLTNEELEIENIPSIPIANALRRILLTEIPTLAITIISITKNVSTLPDEFLAQRIAFIPINSTTVDQLNSSESCSCQNFCESCGIKFSLNASNKGKEPRDVLSTEIKIDHHLQLIDAGSPVLIAKLGLNQVIELSGIIKRGIGREHAKFCPVSAVSIDYDKTNKNLSTEYWNEKDVDREWHTSTQEPDLQQNTEEDDISLKLEVIEGILEPNVVFKKALMVLKDKVVRIKKDLENKI